MGESGGMQVPTSRGYGTKDGLSRGAGSGHLGVREGFAGPEEVDQATEVQAWEESRRETVAAVG